MSVVGTSDARRPRPRKTPIGPLAVLASPLGDGLSLGSHLVAGFLATASAVFTMHPMDTLKTVMQRAEDIPLGGAAVPKRSLVNAARSVVKEAGPLGFYNGIAVNVSAQAPAGAIKFTVYESLVQWTHARFPKEIHTVLDFGCGALAFVACSGVLVPGEVLKSRLQAGVYPNLAAGLKEMVRTEGVRGFYTGYRATLARDVPYTMLEFGCYASFKKALRAIRKKDKLTAKEELIVGGLAGGVTGFLTTPLDVAKTKLMTQSHVAVQDRYKNVADVLLRVGQADGLPGVFQGASARVAWLIPFTAIYFGVHEATKRGLRHRAARLSATAVAPPASRTPRKRPAGRANSQ